MVAVELGQEARRGRRELLADLAHQPAVGRVPAHEDERAHDLLVESRRLGRHLQALGQVPLDLAPRRRQVRRACWRADARRAIMTRRNLTIISVTDIS